MNVCMNILGMALLIVAVTVAFSNAARAAEGVPGEKADESAKVGLANVFFAMDTGTKDDNHRTAKAQVEMVKELGYAGLAYSGGSPQELAEILAELDKNGLKAFPVYCGVNLDPDKPKYDPGLEETIRLLANRDTAIWIHIGSQTYPKSSPEGDPRAVEILTEVADMAQASNVQVVFYPHVNDWLERVEDGLRLLEKMNRKDVAVTFNLYHWLRVDDEKNLEPLLKRAMPHLAYVNINGSSHEGSIETLDRGEFDLYAFLKTLKDMGYTGPIGLQGYGIGGDVHDNLTRSMESWRALCRRLAE